MMGLFRQHTKVRKKIEKLDTSRYVKKAKELFGLTEGEVKQAVLEYKHFLYLLYWNRREHNDQPVVPTKRADKLWHAHLLFNGEYNPFCEDVYGVIIAHCPGLEEGTDPFNVAVLHTKQLHDRVGKHGFDSDYFSFVKLDRRTVNQSPANTPVIDSGCGGVTVPASSPVLDGGGDSGGCGGSSCGGSSCGGGGCGGGGCGG